MHLEKRDTILEQKWKEKVKHQESGKVPDSHDSVEEEPDMVFQEGEVVWYDASGEEPHLVRISEVEFELYILVDVKADEEFCSFPENLKHFDSKPSSALFGKPKSQEEY
jgi:hypothetical protein